MTKPTNILKEWRQFELLVSRLEEALKPQGYKFKSPDRLLDHDTGELREVDCSIRYEQDGIEKLISIECRKRGGKEDVTWIEQLAAKMESLGLSGTIAVSSQGFSRSARLKAKRKGITLKTYEDITDKDVLDKFKASLQFRHISQRAIKVVSFQFEAQDDSPEIPEQLRPQLAQNVASGAAKVLFSPKTNEYLTLDQIVELCLSRSTITLPGIATKSFRIGFEPNTVIIADFPMTVYLESLKLEVEMETKISALEATKLQQYRHEDTVLIEAPTWTIETSRWGRLKLQAFLQRGERTVAEVDEPLKS